MSKKNKKIYHGKFTGVPAKIFDNPKNLTIWCKGFLKGFGKRAAFLEEHKLATSYVNELRVCRGKHTKRGNSMKSERCGDLLKKYAKRKEKETDEIGRELKWKN